MQEFLKIFIPTIMVGVLVFIGLSTFNFKNIAQQASLILSTDTDVFEQCIANFSNKNAGEFTIKKADLNSDKIDDGLLQYKDEAKCGSGGCMYELCISTDTNTYEYIPFGFVAESISVLNTQTRGMKDLQLNNNTQLKMTWNGSGYSLQ